MDDVQQLQRLARQINFTNRNLMVTSNNTTCSAVAPHSRQSFAVYEPAMDAAPVFLPPQLVSCRERLGRSKLVGPSRHGATKHSSPQLTQCTLLESRTEAQTVPSAARMRCPVCDSERLLCCWLLCHPEEISTIATSVLAGLKETPIIQTSTLLTTRKKHINPQPQQPTCAPSP